MPVRSFLAWNVKIFATVLSVEWSVSAGGSPLYLGIPAGDLGVVLSSLWPSPGLSVGVKDFSSAAHICPLLPDLPHTYRILPLKHRLYFTTLQQSVTAVDKVLAPSL